MLLFAILSTQFSVLDPDRMFTSRSEYRISLRSDNADLRLTAKARALGPKVISDARWATFQRTRSMLEDGKKALEACALTPQKWCEHGFEVRSDGRRRR